MSKLDALTTFCLALDLCLAGCGLYAIIGKPRQRNTGLILIGSAGLGAAILLASTTRLSRLLFNRLIVEVDLIQLVNLHPAIPAAMLIVVLAGIVWGVGFRNAWATLAALGVIVGLGLWQLTQPAAAQAEGAVPVLVAAAVSILAANALIARPRVALALPVLSLAAVAWLAIAANTPEEIPDPVLAAGVPAGFHLNLFAQLSEQPTGLTFDADGAAYVSTLKGRVFKLFDSDGDGRADRQTTFAGSLGEPLGIVWHKGMVYISTHTLGKEYSGRIVALEGTTGSGTADRSRDIVTGLPAGFFAWHQNNSLALGPDERLYLGIGSTSDHNIETVRYAASIISVNLDGSDLRLVATGLRNPFGLAFSAEGQLFATDNGPDQLDSALAYVPPDELNLITPGGDYGFPKYYGDVSPATGTISPVALFTMRTVPTGLAVYSGSQFPAGYRGNIFVALWQPGPRLDAGIQVRGQRIARLALSATTAGQQASDQDFVTGLQGPIDVKVGPAGDLYIADMLASRIYRVSFTP